MESTPAHSDWRPLTRQLIQGIADLFEYRSQRHTIEPDDDYTRLLATAEKLENFCQSISETQLNTRATWHDLRNQIGTVIGYIELIQEENPIDPGLHHLDKALLICQQILHIGEEDITQELPVIDIAPNQSVDKGTILIVDDQQESRDLLRRHLQNDQHTVLEAAHGEEMFQVLQSNEVDLIVLDLILPEMNGDILLQRVKMDQQLRAIPVIVVSGLKDTEQVIRCIEIGAEDYLFKPFNTILLRARINAGIERKRWHDREQQYRQELERNQQFIRSVFGRYLSKEIVETLLENPDGLDLGGTQRKVTVLMADICGFTTIAEQLPPDRVVKLLNIYLGHMTDIIMQHQGTVDEFIGDAILAIFGAPISREDDSDRAVQCALAMQQAMTDINALNRQHNLPEIQMGISINTGPVIAGNIGSEKRAKYGIVGHTVNQTARIEDKCNAGSILISDSTVQDSSLKLAVSTEITIKAKGILEAIKAYELKGIH